MVAVSPGCEESVTSTVKAKVPAFVGVPETTPLVADKDSPAGSAPDESFQVYGEVPPLADSVTE